MTVESKESIHMGISTTPINADLHRQILNVIDVVSHHPEFAGLHLSIADGVTRVAVVGEHGFRQDQREHTVDVLADELHLPHPAVNGLRGQYETQDHEHGVTVCTLHRYP